MPTKIINLSNEPRFRNRIFLIKLFKAHLDGRSYFESLDFTLEEKIRPKNNLDNFLADFSGNAYTILQINEPSGMIRLTASQEIFLGDVICFARYDCPLTRENYHFVRTTYEEVYGKKMF